MLADGDDLGAVFVGGGLLGDGFGCAGGVLDVGAFVDDEEGALLVVHVVGGLGQVIVELGGVALDHGFVGEAVGAHLDFVGDEHVVDADGGVGEGTKDGLWADEVGFGEA